MINFKKSIIFFIALSLGACASKNNEFYNLSAQDWFKKIMEDVKSQDLEKADQKYTIMASEHIASPLLEEVVLILSKAHSYDKEYSLANFYLDEYIKKYGDDKKTEFARYQKIKVNFESFTYANRNQKLLQDSINDIYEFLKIYPNSEFKPMLKSMLIKFELALFELDKEIYKLYKKTGKKISAEIYEEKIKNSKFQNTKIIEAKTSWFRKIFE